MSTWGTPPAHLLGGNSAQLDMRRAEVDGLREQVAKLEAEVQRLTLENTVLQEFDGVVPVSALHDIVRLNKEIERLKAEHEKTVAHYEELIESLRADRDRISQELREAREYSADSFPVRRDDRGVVDVYHYPSVTQAPPPPPTIKGGTGDPGILRKKEQAATGAMIAEVQKAYDSLPRPSQRSVAAKAGYDRNSRDFKAAWGQIKK